VHPPAFIVKKELKETVPTPSTSTVMGLRMRSSVVLRSSGRVLWLSILRGGTGEAGKNTEEGHSTSEHRAVGVKHNTALACSFEVCYGAEAPTSTRGLRTNDGTRGSLAAALQRACRQVRSSRDPLEPLTSMAGMR
jgi:hypothetical protein